MHERNIKGLLRLVTFAVLLVCTVSVIFFARFRPAYFSNINYLGAFLLLELIIASSWHYEKSFFALLMVGFLWAGLDIPFTEVWTSARWLVLGVGAAIGYVKWMKGQRQHFGAAHLVAFFCVVAALVSALVSAYPQLALAKVLSLCLLFVYTSSGARLAILGREAHFVKGLLLGCEIIVYVSAFAYLLFHLEIWGNPNSLGAMMGVVAEPFLLWGTLVSDTPGLRYRRAFALLLCAYLLYFSLSRAGMVAGAIATVVLCLSLRKQRLIIQGTIVVVFFLTLAAIVEPAHFERFTASFTSSVLYKGKQEKGLFGSRKTPWQETISVIDEHPWFGSGFGTASGNRTYWEAGSFSSTSTTTREHGSSYLAITEWVGLLGIIPFVLLLFLVLQTVARVCSWMHQTASPCHYSIPLAIVLVAGLAHAIFEDWLFAVGYYLTVFFWSLAFMLMDMAPTAIRTPASAAIGWRSEVTPQPTALFISR